MAGRIGLSEVAFLVLCAGVFLIYAGVFVIPFWRIFRRAGFNPWLSVLMPIPLLNVALCFFLAFARWPTETAR
jgi:hypothetical protein